MSEEGTEENPAQLEYNVGGSEQIQLGITFGYAQVGASVIIAGPGAGQPAGDSFHLGSADGLRGETSLIRHGILDVSRSTNRFSIIFEFYGGDGDSPQIVDGRFSRDKEYLRYFTVIKYV